MLDVSACWLLSRHGSLRDLVPGKCHEIKKSFFNCQMLETCSSPVHSRSSCFQACLSVWRHILKRFSSPLSCCSNPTNSIPHLWTPTWGFTQVSTNLISEWEEIEINSQPAVCACKRGSGLYLPPTTSLCNRCTTYPTLMDAECFPE